MNSGSIECLWKQAKGPDLERFIQEHIGGIATVGDLWFIAGVNGRFHDSKGRVRSWDRLAQSICTVIARGELRDTPTGYT